MSVITRRCVTAADIIARGDPCDEAWVREVWGGRCLTALEALDLNISTEDKLRAVIAEQFISEKILTNLACDFLERALPVWEQWADRNARELLAASRWGVAISRERVRGGANESALVSAYQEVALAIDVTWAAGAGSRVSPAWPAHLVATGVLSLLEGAPYAATFRAAHAVSRHAVDSLADPLEKHVNEPKIREAEYEWQVARVREVLQGGG